MSSNQPAGVGQYLLALMPRGGRIAPHADGWGVAFYEDHTVRIFKDAAPAAESRYLSQLAQDDFKSTSVLAHIRRANPAVVGRAMVNTHPFERECNGRSWVFAHNGKLPGLLEVGMPARCRYQPIGGTDSELAFCLLLDAIAGRVDHTCHLDPEVLVSTIQPLVTTLRQLGEFNFILSDGEHLYAHADTQLHCLQRSHDSSTAARKILLATAPLTAQVWQALTPGTIHIYKAGEDISCGGWQLH